MAHNGNYSTSHFFSGVLEQEDAAPLIFLIYFLLIKLLKTKAVDHKDHGWPLLLLMLGYQSLSQKNSSILKNVIIEELRASTQTSRLVWLVSVLTENLKLFFSKW